MQKVYGYVRVSTKDQNEDRQMIAMREANVPEKNIVVEKINGDGTRGAVPQAKPYYCR